MTGQKNTRKIPKYVESNITLTTYLHIKKESIKWKLKNILYLLKMKPQYIKFYVTQTVLFRKEFNKKEETLL